MSYEPYRAETFDAPRRQRTQRQRERPTSEYVEATYADYRDAPRSSRQLDLVRRPREDSEISVEEVQRAFPPGAGYRDDRRRPRRARSLERSHGGRYDDEAYYGYADPRYSAGSLVDSRSGRPSGRAEKGSRGRSLSRGHELASAVAGAGLAIGGKELWDRNQQGGKNRRRSKSAVQTAALGVAGAVAGDLAAKQYSKSRGKSRDRRHEHDGYDGVAGYPHDEYDRPRPSRRKSISEVALGALGLGAAADSGRSRDDRRHHRRRGSSSSGYSSRSRSQSQGRAAQAAKAALTAAAAEAWRSRKDGGGWLEGERARRIVTAAVGAGGTNALVDRDPDTHSKRHTAEGAIGGLLLNRLVNGSRDEAAQRSGSRSRSRSRRQSRTRSRSRGGGGGDVLKDLGVAGLAAGAAKKFLDSRKSRSPPRRRRYSSSSDDSYSPRPRRSRARSRSVGAMVNRGLSKVGLREPSPREDDRRVSRRDDDYSQSKGNQRGGGRARGGGVPSSDSETDSEFSLSDEERRRKKMKGKEILTAGLATVATIHAAHGIYGSMEARDARTTAVAQGKMSEEEAKALKKKALFQDTASVGLAALGVKGAYSEWKTAGKERKENQELKEKVERHRRIADRRNLKRSKSTGANPWRDSAPHRSSSGYDNGPVYADGNPYASGGAGPPYDDRRY
ncbi:MAG: hypothetical protein M1837_002662 [Sclerophora amabilis]|nr:MAG: hypothetical protein M1837_002662 [Sclerophora amabilis]